MTGACRAAPGRPAAHFPAHGTARSVVRHASGVKTGRAVRPQALPTTKESVMTTTTFDPIKYKQTTREQWETAADAWND